MPSFNISVIPPENRGSKQIAEHIEIYKRSMDLCRVHNPTDEDYVIHNDKALSNERWVVPAQTKDLGKGLGNADVPRYVAKRYIKKMGKKLIYAISEKQWAKDKMQYRREDWGTYEERLAIRATDQKQWDKIVPTLFLGVVERYQMNEPDYVEQTPTVKTFSKAEDSLERLGIADMDIDLESAKQGLIDQIK